MERHGVALLPPGLPWRVVADGTAELLVTEIPQR
jgi:hypothetical protein